MKRIEFHPSNKIIILEVRRMLAVVTFLLIAATITKVHIKLAQTNFMGSSNNNNILMLIKVKLALSNLQLVLQEELQQIKLMLTTQAITWEV